MSAPELSKHLQLSVTNLGPIARANIELRPMTVFVGPSNTGKSYLAILIYALHRFFSGTALWPADSPFSVRGSVFDEGSVSTRAITHEEAESLIAWHRHTSQVAGKSTFQEAVDARLPDFAARLVRPLVEAVGDNCKILDAEIARCFGVEGNAGLVRNRIAKGSRVEVSRPATDVSGTATSLGYSFAFNRNQCELASHVPDGALLYLLENEHWHQHMSGHMSLSAYGDHGRTVAVRIIMGTVARAVGRSVVSPLSLAAHYLPADRTGIMHSHRVVVGSLIGQAARAGFARDVPLPRLSGVLADFLEQLIGLEEPSQMTGRTLGGSLAGQIERNILQGEIRTARSPVGHPEFLYRPEGWKEDLGLMNTSSMVSELAPVVLYLRYVVRPGETLIIEEPESHLHPALQVEFTRQLAAVALSGVRVIITTHSEWVLEELANLVRLSELPKSRRKGIGSAPYALGRDQLGVWRFEPKKRPKGSVVREIPFNPDIGNFDSGFDRVAMATYNDQAEIIRREERLKASAGRC